MRFVVLIIPCIILLYNCQGEQSAIPEIEKLIIDTRDAREPCIDSLFKIDKIIRLETRPDIVIGQINEVVFSRVLNRIIVLDSRHRKSVFLFDTCGHHVSSIIHSDSKDPFLPYDMRDIAVDEFNNDLFILDIYKKSIFNYDYNGKIKNRIISLDFPAQSIKSINNGDLLVQNKSSNYQKRPILYNLERHSGFKTSSFKYFGMHQGEGVYHREISNFSDGNNESIIYSNYLSDTIYRISGRSYFEPCYYVDFQKSRAPSSFFSSLDSYNSWYGKFKESEYGVKLGYFIENKDCVMFPFYLKGSAFIFYKRHSSMQAQIYQYPNFGFSLPKAPIGFYDAGIVLSLESFKVQKFLNTLSKDNYKMNIVEEELFQFLENHTIDSEDNQILIFIKIL